MYDSPGYDELIYDIGALVVQVVQVAQGVPAALWVVLWEELF